MTAPAEADTLEQQLNDADKPAAPEPVVVDLDSNEIVAEPEKQAEPPKPKLPRPQARVKEALYERDQSRAYAQQLEAELAQSRREAAEAKAREAEAQRIGMTNYSERVKGELSTARSELLSAKQSGDAEAEVAAQEKLARAAASASDIEAWETTQQRQPAQQQQPEPQRQQPQRQQEPPPLPDEVRDFIQEQAWFNPVLIGDDGRPVRNQNGQMAENPDYDPEMHDVAMLADKKIQRQIRLGALPKDYMQTAEYFQSIKNAVADAFPDMFEGEKRETPARAAAPARQPVAPANRSSVPSAGKPNGGTRLTLDGEQAELVRSLVDNGTLRYSRNHQDVAKRGQKMTYNDAYLQYAKQYQADQANRNQNQN